SLLIFFAYFVNCTKDIPESETKEETITPLVISEPVKKDSDDPAIWLNPTNPANSMILGTDKGGSLFAFGLDGKIIKSVSGMNRLNNVDVEYGFLLNG
ncbi:MAG: phytase, partial [candidate division Zixibacteria bacterium]|nr:phytase [Gammaproteobacteria bacterium]NIR48764.1 phytase [candidate division KSB1 bacterium]NIR64105.1 phytase [candidate division Zixibacteria bacterium]NIS46003.1 phytase [candidate division Zixibacteria bacterium]NIT71220.1 phytase [candidate division KSB1 bacterium]